VRRVAALFALLVVAACSASAEVITVEADPSPSGPGENVAPGAGTLDWGGCGSRAGDLIDLECATLAVPLEHTDPDGESIEVAVARTATANPDRRIGSLVFNPGGPGGSGIDFLTAAAALVPAAIADRFDLVSFDPRGVGESTAVECEVDFDDDVTLLAAGDDAGWERLLAEAEARVDTCTTDSIEFELHVGTNNTARDLDALRAALGDEQLSYVGFSYGTRLGATYAELFPDRVRALVLDGAVKPTDDLALLGLEQGPGFDAALESFAAACDNDADCALADVGPALDVVTGLIDEIDGLGSLPTDDEDRILTPGELQLGVIAALYSTQLWPVLADALHAAETRQDGTLLQALADSYLGRQPDGTYDNSQLAGFTINCADDPRRPPSGEVRRQAELAASSSEYFGDFLRASTGCIGTPEANDPISVGPAEGAAPILVIGTTGDPATPYEWSVEMSELLSSGVLYTVEAEGHTAFLSVPCVDAVVVDYLVDLELPGQGSSCAADAPEDVFVPAGSGEFDQIIAFFDCLRSNGLDLPDITIGDLLADPNGELLLDLLDPSDPAFGEAALACQDLIPGF
jgi:pimeloyl-ACP methyl ester carboxylesterase